MKYIIKKTNWRAKVANLGSGKVVIIDGHNKNMPSDGVVRIHCLGEEKIRILRGKKQNEKKPSSDQCHRQLG